MIDSLDALNKVRDECYAMVTNRALASGGAAAIPGAIAGIGADVVILQTLLPKINRAFGLDASQIDQLDEQGREQLLLLVSKIGNLAIGKVVTEQLVKTMLKRIGVSIAAKSVASFVPFIGSGVAATISFTTMKLVGNGHVDECYAVVRQMIEGRGGRPGAARMASVAA